MRCGSLYLAQKILLYKDERKIAFVLRRCGALIKCVLGGARTSGAVQEDGSARELIPFASFNIWMLPKASKHAAVCIQSSCKPAFASLMTNSSVNVNGNAHLPIKQNYTVLDCRCYLVLIENRIAFLVRTPQPQDRQRQQNPTFPNKVTNSGIQDW